MPPTLPDRLVLYDGVCGLCDRSVQFFLENDRDGTLRFAPLQSETGQRVLATHPELAGVDSVIFVEREPAGDGHRDGDGDGKAGGPRESVYVRSKAVFRIARYLHGNARFLGVFSFLPQAVADAGYDLVASVRYRIFGKLEQCRIPSPEVRARFLP